MGQREPRGVKEVAGVAGQRAGSRKRKPAWAVERIAHQWMSGGGEVDPNLVRPAGLDGDFDERAFLAPLEDLHEAQRSPPARRGSVNGPEDRMGHRLDRNVD